MAASTQLERIAELVGRVSPLGSKRTGMRIEADEWNELVATLLGILEIDRSQERTAETALAENYAPKVHQHLGEVSVEWLDADLQTRLGQAGAGGGLSTRALAAELEQRVAGLGEQLARLTTRAEEQQRAVDRGAADALERSRTLRAFEERFGGLENLRTLVTTLSGQVTGLSRNVDVVLQLRSSLSTPEGLPIDVAGLRQQVLDLQALRGNLLGVDGQLIRVRELEVKIADLEDAVGVGGDQRLDLRIAADVSAAEGRLNQRVDDRTGALRTELLGVNQASVEQLRAELGSSSQASEGRLLERIGTEVAAAETRGNARLDSRLAGEVDRLRQDLTTSTSATIDARLVGLPTLVRQTVDATRAQLESGLRTSLTESLTGVIQTQVAAAEGRLGQRVGTLETRVGGLVDTLPTRVSQEVDALRAELSTSLDQRAAQQVAQLQAALQADLSQRIAAATSASLDGLRQQLETLVQQRTAGLSAQVSTAVDNALRTLPDQVSQAVRTEVAALNLSGQLDQLGSRLTEQFRAELGRAVTTLQADLSTRNAETVSLLRGEIAAARRSAIDEADTRSAGRIDLVRGEFDQNLNTRLSGLETNLTRRIDSSVLRGGPFRPGPG